MVKVTVYREGFGLKWHMQGIRKVVVKGKIVVKETFSPY